jgi:hypothetical protein
MSTDKPKREWTSINVRPDAIKLAERFAAILAHEKGVRVAKADAVRIALTESIERRKAK